jgi:hypothetical protein
MPEKEPKDVALKEAQLPAQFLNENGIPLGCENISKDDMVLPSIQIIQALSDNVELGMGKIFNTITNEASETLDVIPITFNRGRVYFVDRELICKSNNGIVSESEINCSYCEKSHWQEGQKPPVCSETRNFLVMLPDHSLAMLIFKKSGLIDAKKLIRFVKTANVNFFFFKIELSSEKKESPKGPYYALKMKYDKNTLTNEIERATALDWYHLICNKDLTIDESSEAETQAEKVLCPECQSPMNYIGVNDQTGKGIWLCSKDSCGKQILRDKE